METVALLIALSYPTGDTTTLQVGEWTGEKAYTECLLEIPRAQVQIHSTLSVANLENVTCVAVVDGDYAT